MTHTAESTEPRREVTQTEPSMLKTLERLCETNPEVLSAVISPLLTAIAERAIAGFEGVEEDLSTVLATVPDGYVIGVSQNLGHHLDVGIDDGDGPASWDRLVGERMPAASHQWFYRPDQIFVLNFDRKSIVGMRTSTEPSVDTFTALNFEDNVPAFSLEVVTDAEASRRTRELLKA